MNRITVIDYDAGNTHSVINALEHLGCTVKLTRDAYELLAADKVILPGVGAYSDSMKKLEEYKLIDVIHRIIENDTPFMGICLGLQLLFKSSEECIGEQDSAESIKGLGILDGKILRIPPSDGLKIPHMCWNSLDIRPGSRLFHNIPDNSFVYFVHSYYLHAVNRNEVAATTEYGVTIDSSIEYKNIFGCQFHPEKSGKTGLKILQNFCNINL